MTRANHARTALIKSFGTAMVTERFSRLSVRGICADAGVGRSTFYLHYRNLDAMLMEAVSVMIDNIALSLTGALPTTEGEAIFTHIWEQRRHSELWRDAGFRSRFTAALAARLERETGSPLSAQFAAAGVTETLRGWTAGRLNIPPAALLADLKELFSRLGRDSNAIPAAAV